MLSRIAEAFAGRALNRKLRQALEEQGLEEPSKLEGTLELWDEDAPLVFGIKDTAAGVVAADVMFQALGDDKLYLKEDNGTLVCVFMPKAKPSQLTA